MTNENKLGRSWDDVFDWTNKLATELNEVLSDAKREPDEREMLLDRLTMIFEDFVELANTLED